MLNSALLSSSYCLNNHFLEAFKNFCLLHGVIFECLREEFALTHHEIIFYILHITVVLLNRKVRQMLEVILDFGQVVRAAANTKVKLIKHVDLERIKTGDEHPLTNIKLSYFIIVVKQ